MTFNISGAVAGATVSVYMDGGTTPIATGTVATGATSITLTTDGATTIPSGNHEFTVQQTIATPAVTLYAGWTDSSGQLNPGTEFPIAAGSVSSPASVAIALSVGTAAPVAPSGYAIAANPATISTAAAATDAGFTFSGAEPYTTYTYTITSSGGPGSAGTTYPVVGSGTVTSATQTVSGIDVSTLADGTLTISVTLSDTSGNVGTPVTTTVVLNV